MFMTILNYIITVSFIVNIFFILTMIFIERKKPHTIMSWAFIMFFIPILGFILYVLIGGGLSYNTKRMLKSKKLFNEEYQAYVNSQKSYISANKNKLDGKLKYRDLIMFNMNISNSALMMGNNIKLFTNGDDKIEALKADLRNATHSINILYYIFANDETGKEIMEILIDKAKRGVKVKLIYDSVGSLRTPRKFFKKLKSVGGEVCEFFPPLFGIRLINLKMNYRNHKKIVVIDGRIGYLGGVNIRNDHRGKDKRLSPWRDTHIRIVGPGVFNLQNSFFSDWRYVSKSKIKLEKLEEDGYFPEVPKQGDVGMQVVTSGPETTDRGIRDAMIRMIFSAKNSIYIQTPYFVPDETFLNALSLAKMSGVDITVMIPGIADKRIVYAATLSYVKNLVEQGINVYFYHGFLHSKTMIVDDELVTIGTSNIDNRSFSLNFEINSFLYNTEFGRLVHEEFIEDLENSTKVDLTFFKRKPIYSKIALTFFRIFSPLL